MRIIAEGTIRQWAGDHARAAVSLRQWVKVVRPVRWRSFAEMRRTFPSADLVTVKSGRKVAVFNVGDNEFRLICAVHFNTGMVFALRFLSMLNTAKTTGKTNCENNHANHCQCRILRDLAEGLHGALPALCSASAA